MKNCFNSNEKWYGFFGLLLAAAIWTAVIYLEDVFYERDLLRRQVLELHKTVELYQQELLREKSRWED